MVGQNPGKPILGFFWVFDKDPIFKVLEFFEQQKWGFHQYICNRQCIIVGDCIMPLAVDFGSSKLGQTISGFLWVLVRELGIKFAEFSKHQRWSFLQSLSNQQCNFLVSTEH